MPPRKADAVTGLSIVVFFAVPAARYGTGGDTDMMSDDYCGETSRTGVETNLVAAAAITGKKRFTPVT